MTTHHPGSDARQIVLPRTASIDFATIHQAALPHLEALCARWLPGGRRQGSEWACGSLAGESGSSCKVNLRTGRWADFATNKKGGDVISLAAAIHRISQAEAARNIATMLGIPAGGQKHV
ncbi:hypothetical protein [Roseomonas elaeocarpi]|uniref:Zinc finger CHC2-type domain-containing protein n=1 Tax=Roseomonas elaeocarpi TaxID=907779 RepID=A0ABV6JVM3_9PROT